MVDNISGQATGRRGLIAGAGATALLLGAIANTTDAAAAPSAGGDAARIPDGTPAVSNIASAGIGLNYRHLSFWDFTPESPAASRAWSGGGGVYQTGVGATVLWASLDVPAGSWVREIEWYVRNSSAGSVTGLNRLWVAGSPYMVSCNADSTIPVGGAVTATRTVYPSSSLIAGPHPLGTKLCFGVSVPNTATVLINGVRVGFAQGAGQTGLLPSPIRAYDSRISGGKLTGGGTRTVTLPASAVPANATGVLVNVTATEGAAPGYLKVWSATGATPTASAINYGTGENVANAMTVSIPPSRQLKVYAHSSVHVILDVTGFVS